MSCTFWNMRRRKRAELAKQQAPIEADQQEKAEVKEMPKETTKPKKGGKKNDK